MHFLSILPCSCSFENRYIGGEEVNSTPTHSHHRYVINFGEMTEDEARQYPDLIKIVEEKVKPARLKQNREIRARYWWRFGETTPALFRVIAPLDRVLVTNAQASTHLSFIFYSPKVVFANSLNVFPLNGYPDFSVLQSRIHELFAWYFSSSLEDRLRYNPSDCFETFPFPTNWENNPQLEAIGKEYYEYRAQLMISNNQGLTTTYNRFHDPDEYDSAILKLRDLHNQCDRAVLNAYGWTDLQPTCEFLLDYEDEEETDPFDSPSTGSGHRAQGSMAERSRSHRQKKKPYRYRWADEIRDEVLARLLALNEERYVEEVLRGDRGEGKSKKAKGKTKNKQPAANNLELQFP
ncbi:type IIL restriction-modification enzyme MmeI [Pseudanabaena galeata UHCC 0370]|uniref:site-specific DNA-methyltransferase (adenine-specific) n=1 Tax=Pseudanabaena galeata UHCC 0370 TaxID=3110310 RepID=A0ABU5TIF1_9CYAN|nr:type IIL restriction-modification enzyme MmeI [Pseudanabaena galeata]MEA5478034.1 type IIL restriction-modification enzyme MmeI [Pseudanabaena galeata UHCC 0370]